MMLVFEIFVLERGSWNHSFRSNPNAVTLRVGRKKISGIGIKGGRWVGDGGVLEGS